MARTILLPMLSMAICVTASAQEPIPRFQWKAGQTLDYRVEQTTTVTYTAEKNTATTVAKLNVSKRWEVAEVDSAGVATLNLSLLKARVETKTNGQTVVFDSEKPDQSNADLNKKMLQYIGPTIAVLRMDGLGRLVEVKKSEYGPASRFEAELPFRITLPGTALAEGQTWDRNYVIKMEPPHGAGETYAAVQKYTCRNVTKDVLVIGLTTPAIKDLPDAPADRIPLVPFQSTGTVTFDIATSRMKKAELRTDAEFADHRGEGSKYRYSSVYLEELK